MNDGFSRRNFFRIAGTGVLGYYFSDVLNPRLLLAQQLKRQRTVRVDLARADPEALDAPIKQGARTDRHSDSRDGEAAPVAVVGLVGIALAAVFERRLKDLGTLGKPGTDRRAIEPGCLGHRSNHHTEMLSGSSAAWAPKSTGPNLVLPLA